MSALLDLLPTMAAFLFGGGGLLAYLRWRNKTEVGLRYELRDELTSVRERLDAVEDDAYHYRSRLQDVQLQRRLWMQRSQRLEQKVDALMSMLNGLRLKMEMDKIDPDDIPPVILDPPTDPNADMNTDVD